MKNTQKGATNAILIAIIVLLAALIGYLALKDEGVLGNQPVASSSAPTISESAIKPVPLPTFDTESVRVISPNGGEILKIGQVYKVSWFDDSDAGNKEIRAVNTMVGGMGMVIGSGFMRSSGIDGNFYFEWNVDGGTPAGKYRLFVCKVEKDDCDLSDAAFTISR
jgi:hypothetical protein